MKKIAAMMMLMLLLTLLSGCQANVSTIEVAKLDEGDQIYEDMLGPGTETFDLVLGKDARSIHMNLYQLVNGEWVPLVDGGRNVINSKERNIVGIYKDNIRLRSGGEQYHLPINELMLDNPGIGIARINEKTELELEAQVPVFLYVESSTNKLAVALSDFYHPEKLAAHERVYALTAMVSGEEVK